MNILTLFSTIPLGHEGFGFNGNILETNIINLSVVVAVVVSFGGDALRSLLETRRQTIIKNFEDAKQRSAEAREKLTKAMTEISKSKIKASEIRQQIVSVLQKERLMSSEQLKTETSRLQILKQETILFQEQKAKLKVSTQIVKLAVQQVENKIKKRLTPRLHDSVNNFNIVLLRNM